MAIMPSSVGDFPDFRSLKKRIKIFVWALRSMTCAAISVDAGIDLASKPVNIESRLVSSPHVAIWRGCGGIGRVITARWRDKSYKLKSLILAQIERWRHA